MTHCDIHLVAVVWNWTIKISQRSQRYAYILINLLINERKFIRGIGSPNYGGWEVSQQAICKLENQGGPWYNFQFEAEALGARGRGCAGVSPSPKAGESGVLMSKGSQRKVSLLQNKDHIHLSSLPFCWMRPSADWTAPALTKGRSSFLSPLI